MTLNISHVYSTYLPRKLCVRAVPIDSANRRNARLLITDLRSQHGKKKMTGVNNKTVRRVLAIHKTPVTPGLRPGYDLYATTEKSCSRWHVVERTYDCSQRSWVIARAKSVATRSWPCSKSSHTGLTTRLRPTCDRKMLQSWANRRKNVRLVAEVVTLVAEIVGDRKGQISRNKVDGHVQT